MAVCVYEKYTLRQQRNVIAKNDVLFDKEFME